jgi:transcriptional regulator with PAS, ATPase and Fis domain
MLELKIFQDKKLIQRVLVSKRQITIGRSAENDLILPDEHVSRLHLMIERAGDTFRLEDRSSNGVLLEGEKVSGAALLSPPCRLEIYPFEIECRYQGEEETTPVPKKRPQEAPPPSPSPPSLSPQPHTLIYHFGILIGENPAMQRVYRMIEDVAKSAATVLVRGEHGTGKELAARAIHEASPRRKGPFIAVNSAAIPLDLFESELFGYEKGAFTGAHSAKKGKVEEADGGTLFLDEIGELSLAAQAKLLRFLQGRAIHRLGSSREIPVDVRVIAATNQNLERAVDQERFRGDLYYRLKVVEIFLPPLREHPEDIPLLTAHFVQTLSRELRLSTRPTLTAEAMHRLQSALWPGNIRQLENLLYSALIRSRPPHLLDELILLSEASREDFPEGSQEESNASLLDTNTKQLLLRILKEHQWSAVKAAKALNVSRGTIYYKLKKYGIQIGRLSKGEG